MGQVFLSHRGKEKNYVRTIADGLEQHGVEVWLDDREDLMGRDFQEVLEEAITTSSAVIVFIGRDGIGGWQSPEMRRAISLYWERKIKVIPLLLPGAPSDEELSDHIPEFLRSFSRADFRDGLDDEREMGRLIWALTGSKPRILTENAFRSPEAAPAPASHVDGDLSYLVDSFADRNLTFFVGTVDSQDKSDLPPGSRQLAHDLLEAVGFEKVPPNTEDEWLPNVDYAGTYFAVKKGYPQLERTVRDMILSRSGEIPSAIRRLARLMTLDRPQRRGGQRYKQLIVTTNFDLLLECALLEGGVPFTRLVQYRDGETLQVERYERLPRDSAPLDVEERRRGHALIDWLHESRAEDEIRKVGMAGGSRKPLEVFSSDDYPEPVVYKFHGSVDVARSCAISADQYLRFLNRQQRHELVPSEIAAIINNTDALLLGYELLEPVFQLTYHMLSESFSNIDNRNFALALPPRSPLKTLWDSTKEEAVRGKNVKVLERPTGRFLGRLYRSAETSLSVSR